MPAFSDQRMFPFNPFPMPSKCLLPRLNAGAGRAMDQAWAAWRPSLTPGDGATSADVSLPRMRQRCSSWSA